jgi:hypothetical protein
VAEISHYPLNFVILSPLVISLEPLPLWHRCVIMCYQWMWAHVIWIIPRSRLIEYGISPSRLFLFLLWLDIMITWLYGIVKQLDVRNQSLLMTTWSRIFSADLNTYPNMEKNSYCVELLKTGCLLLQSNMACQLYNPF